MPFKGSICTFCVSKDANQVLKYILKPNAMVMLIFTHPSNRSMPVSTVLDPGEYVTMKSNYFYM